MASVRTCNRHLVPNFWQWEKWLSIVHHIANIHSWNSADLYHQCAHPPIPRNVARTKRWLQPGSPAHEALREVVFNKNLVKDIQQLTLCCHTGSLEVYHSVQTKYVPKRQHFSYEGMVARTQLSALDHNANTGRQHATSSKGANQGELQYKIVFPKHTKEWVAKPTLEKTNRDHLSPMLDAIIARKNQKPQDRSAPPAVPHIPRNIASKPRPAKEEVITKHLSKQPERWSCWCTLDQWWSNRLHIYKMKKMNVSRFGFAARALACDSSHNSPVHTLQLTYLSLTLVSLWLTTEVYLLTSTPNLQTNTNIYSIHLAILYIQKKPFLSVLHSVYDVSALPTLRFILALPNLPLTSLNEVTTVTSSTNKYDAPPTCPANSLYQPKTSTNLNEYRL